MTGRPGRPTKRYLPTDGWDVPSVGQQLSEANMGRAIAVDDPERVVPFPAPSRGGKVIVQEAKIAQQIIKEACGAGGNVTININYSPVANQIEGAAQEKSPQPTAEYHQCPENFDLLDFTERLPAPKVDNLQRALIGMAVLKYGSQAKAAQALGVSRRMVNYWIGTRNSGSREAILQDKND